MFRFSIWRTLVSTATEYQPLIVDANSYPIHGPVSDGLRRQDAPSSESLIVRLEQICLVRKVASNPRGRLGR